MHHKKLEEQSEQQQIRNETTSIFISSEFSNPQNTNKKRTHVHVQVPENQTHFRHESIPSKPHKKSSMMNQAVFHSLPFFSCKKNQRKSFNFESCKRWSFYCSSFATNSFAHKLAQSFYSICLLRFHLRFLILFSLPSLYFFFINPRRFLLLNFLFILSFFICLLVLSLSCTLHRFPSLRILLSRTFPINFTSLPISSSNSNPSLKPVIWSIGSKPKLTKNPNSGSWVKVYSNGDVYEGEFHKGKCSGSGVYYYYKKGRYEGDWIDGKYDGYGVETWARGSRYRGQYIQGLRHGIGVYRFYTGDVYAGEWSNGQCHGCGVHTCDDGSRYVGEFKWGVKHGLGYYHFRNGDTYSGEYFADRMHGFGVYKFGNGHRYEGAWHEGTRQGLGMYSFRNGETQAGHWQNGVLDIATSPTTVPTSSYGVSYSKVLTAVQEAQRAAAKAHNLVRIEERVTRAVAAANKAANAARVASIKAVQNQMHQHESEMHPLQASYP